MRPAYKFMSVELNLANKAEVLEAIDKATGENSVQLATVNPEFILEAEKNTAFRKSLSQMTHAIIDGSGLFFMINLWEKITSHTSFELYHGADLVDDLLQAYQDGSKSFFLLGGPPELAKQAAKAIKLRFPESKIVGATDGGMIDPQNVQVDPILAAELEKANPDIVLVGFGAPKQELWISLAKNSLKIPVMIGVGGTFGFYTNKKRAPQIVRSLHLEWFSRVIHEKGHWKRALKAVIVFPTHALWWMINKGLKR